MKGFLKGAAFFALITVIAKLIGALYRIPLTNIMGVEGIGLYQMVFPLYTVLLTVSSGGLPAAVAKVVSVYSARGDEAGARRVLRISLASLAALGAAASVLLVVFRNSIAQLQGNEKAALAYLGIAPSVFLVAVIAAFRGYYQGTQNLLPSGLSQLTEQAVKLAAGLVLCRTLLPYGAEYAALGALIGVTVSEAVALTGLLIQYFFTTRSYKKRTLISLSACSFETSAELSAAYEPASRREVLKSVYKVAVPVTLGSLIMPVAQVIDSVLVINLLTAGGLTALAATSLFGLLQGPVNTLINLPVVVTLSLTAMLMPRVSGAAELHKSTGLIIGRNLKLCYIAAAFGAAALFAFADEILGILYSRAVTPEQLGIGGGLLRIGSLTVLYSAVIQTSTAALQGSGKASVPVINLLIGAVIKAVLSIALLRLMGIYGAVVSTVVCYGITAALDAAALTKHAPPTLRVRSIAVPTLAAGIMAAAGKTAFFLLKPIGGVPALILSGVIAAAGFITVLILLKGVTLEELSSFPAVEKLLLRLKLKKDMNKSRRRRNKQTEANKSVLPDACCEKKPGQVPPAGLDSSKNNAERRPNSRKASQKPKVSEISDPSQDSAKVLDSCEISHSPKTRSLKRRKTEQPKKT